MGSGTVIRWHAFPLLQLLKKVLPKGFRELLLGEQYFVKPLARVYKSVVYYRTLSGIPPRFSAKALAISAVPPIGPKDSKGSY